MPEPEINQHHEWNEKQDPVQKEQRAEKVALIGQILQAANRAALVQLQPALIQRALAALRTFFATAAPQQGFEFWNRRAYHPDY
jgi:hypothetical protein